MFTARLPTPKRSAQEQREVDDAIANLRDYCTDPQTGHASEYAAAVLTSVSNLYRRHMTAALRPAYLGLEALRRRNSDTFGEDIPINHLTVYKSFRDVIDSLACCIERDFNSEFRKQMDRPR